MKKIISILSITLLLFSLCSVMSSAVTIVDIVRLNIGLSDLAVMQLDMFTDTLSVEKEDETDDYSIQSYTLMIKDPNVGYVDIPAEENWTRADTDYVLKVVLKANAGVFLDPVTVKDNGWFAFNCIDTVISESDTVLTAYMEMGMLSFVATGVVGDEGFVNVYGTFKYYDYKTYSGHPSDESVFYNSPKQKGYSVEKTGDTENDTITFTMENLNVSNKSMGVQVVSTGYLKVFVKGNNKVDTDSPKDPDDLPFMSVSFISYQPIINMEFVGGATLQVGQEVTDPENGPYSARTGLYAFTDKAFNIYGKGDLYIYEDSAGIQTFGDINLDLDGLVKIVDYGKDTGSCCLSSYAGDINLLSGSFDLTNVNSKIFSNLAGGKTTIAAKKIGSTKTLGGKLKSDTAKAILADVENYRHITLDYQPNVEFESNGGTKLNGKKVNSLSELPTPKRDGYVFDGWYSDKGLTKKLTNDDLLDDLTVYAKWTKADGNKSPNTGDASAVFFGALALAGIVVVSKKRSK